MIFESYTPLEELCFMLWGPRTWQKFNDITSKINPLAYDIQMASLVSLYSGGSLYSG